MQNGNDLHAGATAGMVVSFGTLLGALTFAPVAAGYARTVVSPNSMRLAATVPLTVTVLAAVGLLKIK